MIRIAIDGPGGAGKSTIAKELAKRLGIVYVDTGALYRTVGLYSDMCCVDPADPEAVAAILPSLTIEIAYENGSQVIYMNGKRITDEIRTPKMSMYASAVSAIPAVRAFLLETQRSIAEKQSVIMDGRDIGTVIIPDAEVKIFLTASPEERAMRRYKELLEKGKEKPYEEVLAEMNVRDSNDSQRAIAPLVPADDAIIFNNTEYSLEESVAFILDIVRSKSEVNG